MWRNNNLSIVTFALFCLCIVGHGYAGWKTYNEEQQQHGEAPVTIAQFLQSSEFGETIFENWESEFLQMGFFVILTVFLYQKGSSESKKHDGTDEVEKDPLAHRDDPAAPRPVRAGGWRLSIYKNSLSLAFMVFFLVSFLGHAAAGARKYNEEQVAHGIDQRIGMFDYNIGVPVLVRIFSELAK